MVDNRRVSLPVISAGLPKSGPLSPNFQFRFQNTLGPFTTCPQQALSPCPESPGGHRRSLPTTPRSARRSLPGTPRCLSPRHPPPLPDLDEYFPTSSSGASSKNSSCEVSPRRLRPQRKVFTRQKAGMRDSGFVETNNNEEKTQLRSFELSRGGNVDRGFQPRKISTGVVQSRAESRRATCPEIWLFPEAVEIQQREVKRVVLRTYGSSCSGKKTLSHQIHHHAATATEEEISVLSTECDDDISRTINFLLNDEEVQLEIVQESALESCPFTHHQTIFLVVYNVTSRDSFSTAADLLYRICQHRKTAPVPVILVGNKIDLKRAKVVSTIEARMLAKIYKCAFMEVSALMGMNMGQVFNELLQQMRKKGGDEKTLISRIVERGRNIARSCEEIVHRMMRHENSQSEE